MALSTALSNEVASDVRTRGRQYYASGAVQIVKGNARRVQATVRGSQRYDVMLERDKKYVEAWCSCPYCDDVYEPCKHIWATLLAAEERGYLGARNGKPPRYLEVSEELIPDGTEERDSYDDDDEDYYDDNRSEPYRAAPSFQPYQPAPASPSRRSSRGQSWKQHLASLRAGLERRQAPQQRGAWPAGQEILYIVDVPATMSGQGLIVEVTQRQRKKNGEWSKSKAQRIAQNQIANLPDPADRQIIALLAGAREQTSYGAGYTYYSAYDTLPTRYALSEPMQTALFPQMCQTGRGFLRVADGAELRPLRWDDGPPWEFWLEVALDDSAKHYLIWGGLRRGEEQLDLTEPVLLVKGGLVFWTDRVARLQDFDAFDWITLLRRGDPLSVPIKQKDNLLKEMLGLPRLPRLELPEELRFEEVKPTPRPRLKVKAGPRQTWAGQARLIGELSFDYDGEIVPAEQVGRGIYQADQRRFLLRDAAAEASAAEKIRQLGFKSGGYYGERRLELAPRNLPRAVKTLLDADWHVEAEGKLYRQPGEIRIDVTSGIDWFDLNGTVQFDDQEANLPELLAAVKRGENSVQLGDGTFGMLPEDWLKKYGTLAGLGTVEDDHLRFQRSQVGLLDALLASQPEATCDAVFTRMRDELRSFEGVEPVDPPAGFVGELRGYQREGLGWLHFLPKFGFGGCLADDMGLGKTIQVLALLESRRVLRTQDSPDRPGPSLVVMPKSLVFNWKQEAARFTPQLRVLDHTGVTRAKPGEHFDEYDVVLTTYGTLRRDALHFKDLTFDYCILDEAQAIKNANTESAKAARLLRANRRLALSGTPVENHLGELWSLFEFLNPGMLGTASVFQLGGAGARNPSEETRSLLARALRPFILRRTKKQVAKDLPEKTEQTIYCELEPAQRKRYDELREHYRQSLLSKIDRDGINKSKIQILEALLRLRQAACHPGLIDKSKTGEPSAKLDTLLSQLREVTEGGHKVLVFSQFTSLLAIVRDRLDKEKIPYEYLDGRTRDRGSRVEHFQSDPDCKLFLISLKAGGLGLNLTAAEYVFLLDPWWNPAVEAQAIDRTHRIGQTRPVFAYRLIARDTVEEKVLELQQTKRDLADAIINADNSLIRSLGREDLELLLS